MGQAFTPGLKAVASERIVKIRELPIPGETLVSVGDSVTPDTVVARASLQGEVRIVKAAEELNVSPEDVTPLLKCSVGDRVAEGAILAEQRGLWGFFRSTVVSPIEGVVEFVSETTGHVGIRTSPRVFSLSAYTGGVVQGVDQRRSVTIETVGTFVQGVFGVGGERCGALRVLDVDVDGQIDSNSLKSVERGDVVVGGCLPSTEALQELARKGAAGLVTGSIDGVSLRKFVGYDIGVAITGDEAVPFTLIITEGFGCLPMSARIYTLLKSRNRCACSINGATQVRAGAVRPEIIVPLSEKEVTQPNVMHLTLETGAAVRLLRAPYFGQRATVVALPHDPAQISTGAWTRVLRAKLDDGSEVVVPRANVELVVGRE